jgi:hypothetical protein
VLNEAYLVTHDPEALRLAALPGRFVVKANHGSGWNVLVPDKAAADEQALRATCHGWLNQRYGAIEHEPWYNAIPPRLLVERYLEDSGYGTPPDYKFWVFHGVAHFVQVDTDRFTRHTRSFYDRAWRKLEWTTKWAFGRDLPLPAPFADMLAIAERLAAGQDFVRVDLYCLDDRVILFGEMTFAPAGGFEPFLPDKSYDFAVGRLW